MQDPRTRTRTIGAVLSLIAAVTIGLIVLAPRPGTEPGRSAVEVTAEEPQGPEPGDPWAEGRYPRLAEPRSPLPTSDGSEPAEDGATASGTTQRPAL